MIFVSVNTPTKIKGVGSGKAADLTFWESAARMIASVSKSSKIVVEKSTVPVKTAEAIGKVRHGHRRLGTFHEWHHVPSRTSYAHAAVRTQDARLSGYAVMHPAMFSTKLYYISQCQYARPSVHGLTG